MKIAILGAGFSGLATAWHLLQHADCEVTLYDGNGIAGEASGVAAGLLHPYAGLHAKLNHLGREGFRATLDLLKVAEGALSKSVADANGLLRIALTEQQVNDYQQTAQKHDDVVWYTSEACQKKIPGVSGLGGLYIPEAMTVDSKKYCEGLWLACKKRGARFFQEKINDLNSLTAFDKVILAVGAGARNFSELQNLPLTYIKGQTITFRWPSKTALPALPVNSQVYLIPDKKTGSCLAGATYERYFNDAAPDVELAVKELMPKVQALFPELKDCEVLSCHAGVRVSAPQHLPLIKQLSDKIFVITGMGSKGLLYHALYGERLVSIIRDNRDSRDIRDYSDRD